MENEFTTLEKNILKAKGLAEAEIAALAGAGVVSKQDLLTVGDATTLVDLVPDIDPDVAARVMEWATGRAQAQGVQAQAAAVVGGSVMLDSADLVYCVHCGAKQPKDYKSGDLCIGCGKQAEPILSCYWCSASGPGKFCRTCGAEFVATADLDLAVLLRHEGLAKDEIPARLRNMSPQAKDDLWGRVRKMRG